VNEFKVEQEKRRNPIIWERTGKKGQEKRYRKKDTGKKDRKEKIKRIKGQK
jgi:hypothetical protein